MWRSLAVIALLGACGAGGAPSTGPAISVKPANDPTPTLIDLHFKDAPPPAILGAFFGQVGAPFDLNPTAARSWKAISIDADHEPFWSVVEKLESALPANITYSVNKFTVSQTNVNAVRQGRRMVSGPCLVVARDVRNVITLSDPDAPRESAIVMQVFFEPRLKVLGTTMRLPVEMAVDEHGKSLAPAPPAAGSGAAARLVVLPNPLTFDAMLKPPADAGATIAQVKGTLHYFLPDDVKTIEVSAGGFQKPQSLDLHGAVLQVQPVTLARTDNPASNNAPTVNVVLDRNGLSDEAWARVGQLFDAMEISFLDEQRAPLQSNGSGSSNNNNQRTRSAEFTLQRNGAAATKAGGAGAGPRVAALLRVTVPLGFRELAVPYEFKDLPLR